MTEERKFGSAIGLTGGATDNLDAISYAALSNNDIIFTTDNGKLYIHIYDSSSSEAESSPDVIAPDDVGAGNGRHILLAVFDYHNGLNSLQGGTTDEYYHLTAAQHAAAIRDATNALKGLATAAQITKLEGIESGATKYPDTGEQAFTDADHSKLDGIEAGADITDAVNVASSIVGVSAKTTPVDADKVGLIDSAAGWALKNLTWSNIKATLKTYFDTLYNNYTLEAHASNHTDGTDDIQNATAGQKGLATAAQITKLDGIEAAATKYPDSGEQAFTDADHTKLDGIEAGADVTDATNVNAAGAVMESDFNAGTFLYAIADNTPVVKTRAEILALLSGQNGVDFSFNSHKITSVSDPTSDQDAATKKWVENNRTHYVQYRIFAPDTAHTADTGVGGSFRIPEAHTVLGVGAYCDTAGSGSVTTLDINVAGSTILSTKITIDSGEESSKTAATPAVISDSSTAADAKYTFDIDGIASSAAGEGLVIWMKVRF